ELPGRARMPAALAMHPEPILLDELVVREGGPQLLRRGADVGDVDVGRSSHGPSPVSVSGRPAPSGAASRTWRSSARRSPAGAPGSGSAVPPALPARWR